MTTLSDKEKNVVLAVFDEMLRKSYSELNTMLGSETIKEMASLHHRLQYEDHCQRYGKQYDDMTEDDWTMLYEMITAEAEARSYED